MRRALTSLLLAVICAQIAVPFFVADAGSNLPACCRREGKHHCAFGLVKDQPASDGVTVEAAAVQCPLYSIGVAPRLESKGAALPSTFASVPAPAIAESQFFSHVVTSSTNAHHSADPRGPPSFLL